MPARRCSLCGINYPTHSDYFVCRVCDGTTDYVSNAEPGDWEHDVALAQSQPSERDRGRVRFRRTSFERLGYGGVMLDLLAESAVRPHDAAALIERGCPPELAARILL